ncbi:MAG: ribosome biogenesis GTPase Der [Kiritimatiellae bacterium]|jgi:GTP-binding protein|nr:ribosome biogenesis GTPase Der [Kiritimatiellia bacterium]
MTDEVEKTRVVAIVGRPNVGKSAMFNRLVGTRVSIVHAESGVTRDRVMREVNWRDERFELIDTGGIAMIDKSVNNDHIDAGIVAQAEAALQDAEVAILVVDVQAGLQVLDEEVAKILRNSGIKTFVAANKVDSTQYIAHTDEFAKLGFPVFPVSAINNKGFEPLLEAVVAELPEIESVTIDNPLKVAVVGRPNVGKSSYINRILQENRLIVSDVAGTTRDSVDIPFTFGHGKQARHYSLMDTAGMRKMGKIKDTVEKYSQFRSEDSIKRCDVAVLVLDAIQGPTVQDKKIAAMIAKFYKGCVVLVNKWDLQEETQTQFGPKLLKEIGFLAHCPLVFVSSKDGYNIRRSLDAIDHVGAQVSTQIPTGILNRAVQNAYKKVNPQSVNGKRLKIYYVTQTGIEPIRFRFYVNSPKYLKPNYKSYLMKQLRETFGLEGAFVYLDFKARTQKDITSKKLPEVYDENDD